MLKTPSKTIKYTKIFNGSKPVNNLCFSSACTSKMHLFSNLLENYFCPQIRSAVLVVISYISQHGEDS